MNKFFRSITILICLSLFLCSCSLVEAEKTVKDLFSEAPDSSSEASAIDFLKIGEPFHTNNFYGLMDYTIERAELFNDIKEAGLTQEDIDRIVLNFPRHFTCPFVLIDIKVCLNEKSDFDGDYNIGVFNMIDKDLINKAINFPTSEIVYFKQHSEKLPGEFLHYTMSEGETKNFTIGMLVFEDVHPENGLILVMTADIKKHYIELNTSE